MCPVSKRKTVRTIDTKIRGDIAYSKPHVVTLEVKSQRSRSYRAIKCATDVGLHVETTACIQELVRVIFTLGAPVYQQIYIESITTTTTKTIVLQPFVRDYLAEPAPEEAYSAIHPLI